MKLIPYFLLSFCSLMAEASDSSSVENGTQVDLSSSRVSGEAELHRVVREKLSEAEVARTNEDLTGYSTEKLVDMALTSTPSQANPRIDDELGKRPDEVRIALLKELDRPIVPFEVLYRIPFVAGKVDAEFQVEIAKRCLFRNEMKNADLVLRSTEDVYGRGIFSLIRRSKYDETAVLDRLISDDRLEKGSEFEVKWRKEFSKKPKRSRPERREDFTGSGSHSVSGDNPPGETASGSHSSSSIWPYLGAGLLLLIAAGFWYLRRK